jgi:arylsulfatase
MKLAMIFSCDAGCDVGDDTGSPVSEEYGSHGNEFNGLVKGLQISIADTAPSTDLVGPAQAVRIAMARQ